MKRLLRIEALFFLIPIVIACIQIYLTSTSDLTRWRGGGFGMYSEPHPNQGRNVWLMGSRDGRPSAVRLFPADDRWGPIEGQLLDQAVADLEREAMEFRDFPSLPRLEPIQSLVESLLGDHGEERSVAAICPDDDLRIEVIEISISANWDSLQAKRITERTW